MILFLQLSWRRSFQSIRRKRLRAAGWWIHSVTSSELLERRKERISRKLSLSLTASTMTQMLLYLVCVSMAPALYVGFVGHLGFFIRHSIEFNCRSSDIFTICHTSLMWRTNFAYPPKSWQYPISVSVVRHKFFDRQRIVLVVLLPFENYLTSAWFLLYVVLEIIELNDIVTIDYRFVNNLWWDDW